MEFSCGGPAAATSFSHGPVASVLPSPPIPLVFTCPCDRGGTSDGESVCIIFDRVRGNRAFVEKLFLKLAMDYENITIDEPS